MGTAALVLRLGLAATFALAAAGKLSRPAETRHTLSAFGVPSRLTGVSAIALPLAELGVAGLLIPGSTARWGALGAVLLLATFSIAIGLSLARGERPDCNCFGALRSAPVGRGTLVRNLVLAGLAGAVAVAGPGMSVSEAVEGIDGLAMLLACALAANLWFSWQLFNQHGRLIERVRALEEGAVPAAERQPRGLPEGEVAPRFELTQDGETRSLDDLLAPGLPVGLVFSDSGCPGCAALVGRLPTLQAELAGRLEIVLVTEREVALLFHANAVPSAVVVAPDGLIASPLAIGERAIEGVLLSSAEPQPTLQVLDVLGAGA